MTKVSEIYEYINKIAPFNSAMDFDNVGLLCGDKNTVVSKTLVCLDITAPVIEEAHGLGCELIISHHPIIFNPIHKLNSNSIPYMLANQNINAICAHTNLDLSPIGTNFQLAKKLELDNIEIIENWPIAVGNLKKEIQPSDFAQYVKERLDCKGIRFYNAGLNIQKIGICTGAGGDMLYKVSDKVDAFITGEIKHHQIIDAASMKISIADVGHYCSEFVVCAPLADILSNHFQSVQFMVSKKDIELTEHLV